MLIKKGISIVVQLSALMVATLLVVSPVSATHSGSSLFLSNRVLFDSFTSGIDSPTGETDPWWISLQGGSPSGFTVVENQECLYNAVCLTHEKEGRNGFARLSMKPQQYPGVLHMSELSEERLGKTYQEPKRWFPEVGKPVMYSVRMRYSENMNAIGTGGGIGSAGVWLWNAPIEIPDDGGETIVHFDNYNGIGFNWTGDKTFGGTYRGLKAGVVKGASPIYSVDLSNVNMNDWFVGTFIWSKNSTGVESVKFYINTQKVGETTLPESYGSLSVEAWIDNQEAQFGPNGIYIDYANPVEEQNMDIDYISVVKL